MEHPLVKGRAYMKANKHNNKTEDSAGKRLSTALSKQRGSILPTHMQREQNQTSDWSNPLAETALLQLLKTFLKYFLVFLLSAEKFYSVKISI